MMRAILTLAGCLLGGVAVAATIASPQFSDVPANAWYAPYVRDAANLGIIEGYRDPRGILTGRFVPAGAVTVAEALKITLEAAGYDRTLGRGQGHWAAQYLSIALGRGFQITWYGQIDLDRPATRAEVAAMVSDAFMVPSVPTPQPLQAPFRDVAVDTPYATSIAALARDGVVTGDTDPSGASLLTYRPTDDVQRVEVVKVALLARQKYGTPGTMVSVSSSSSSQRSRSSSSAGVCALGECGIAPAMPNWLCTDGSIAGPSCERLPDGRCGWLIRQCALSSSSSSSRRAAITHDVTYDATRGFEPSLIILTRGDAIRFHNTAAYPLSIFSDPHPAHDAYTPLNVPYQIAPGSTATVTFGAVGTYGYHSEQELGWMARVIVQ